METGENEENAQLRQGPLEKFAFDMLQSMVMGNELPNTIATFLLIFGDFQLLIFSLYPVFNIKNVPYVIEYIVDPVTVFDNRVSSHSTHLEENVPLSDHIPQHLVVQIAFWVIAMILIILSLVSATHVGFSFRRGSFRRLSLLSLKTLRIITKLLGSILFIPILQLLLMNLECNYSTNRLRDTPELACLSGFNLPFFVISVIGLAVFIPYAIITSSVYFSFDPAAKSRHARNPISFYDTIDMSSRVALVVLFGLVENSIFLIILLLGLLGYMLYLHVVSQPFYHQEFNQLRCGLLLGAFMSSIVAAISLMIDTPADDKGFFIAWILAYPTGFVGGWFLANVGKSIICRRVYQQMKLVKERQHQNRLHPETHKPILRSSVVDEKSGAALEEGRSINVENPFADGSPMGKGNSQDIVTHKELGPEVSTGMLVVNMAESVVANRTVMRPICPFFHPSDVEVACRFINTNRSAEAKALVREIFEQGLVQFPKNAILRLIYSRYIAAYFGPDPSMETQKNQMHFTSLGSGDTHVMKGQESPKKRFEVEKEGVYRYETLNLTLERNTPSSS
ncbi:hypothetical protein HK102_009009 [Quaeritorhiza haematococci]|nr:hypothetical protein HK102_009009 [Quaeritorhiza haematococci]